MKNKNTIKWKTIDVEHKIFNENGIEHTNNNNKKEVELSALYSYCCHFQHKYFITHFFHSFLIQFLKIYVNNIIENTLESSKHKT